MKERLLTKIKLSVEEVSFFKVFLEIQQAVANEEVAEEVSVNTLRKWKAKQFDTDKYKCCGNENHVSKDCKFRDRKCFNCGKKGHIAWICSANGRERKHSEEKERVNVVIAEAYAAGNNPEQAKRYRMAVKLNGNSTNMEVDTGVRSASLIRNAGGQLESRNCRRLRLH